MKTPSKKFLLKLVADLRVVNREVPTINCGGCGVFAAETYNMLTKLGYKVGLAIIGYKDTKPHIQRNDSGYITPFTHIVVTCGRYFIDSEGVYSQLTDMEDMYYHFRTLTKGMPITLLNQWLTEGQETWNPEFSRKKAERTKQVQKIVYKITKKYRINPLKNRNKFLSLSNKLNS